MSLPSFFRLAASLLLVLLATSIAAAQSATPGRVTTSAGEPLPYASVGVLGKPIGTVANEEGTFSLAPLATAAPYDTVVISCVGFRAQKLTMAQLGKSAEVKLEPQAHKLGEVKVLANDWKRRRIGNNGSASLTSYNFHLRTDKEPVHKLGREVGTVLRVKENSQLEDAHFYIQHNHFRDLLFRLNVRALDAKGHPSHSLLTRDVLVSVANGATGWQHIDLKPFDVQIGNHERVAVTLEWLQGTPDAQRDWYLLTIPGPMSPLHRAMYRDKSEDRWTTLPANLSLYVTALSPRG
ncbi:carboxypeptidase-like regulatory domain-containing protein [Hymenobacter sp. HD11105]